MSAAPVRSPGLSEKTWGRDADWTRLEEAGLFDGSSGFEIVRDRPGRQVRKHTLPSGVYYEKRYHAQVGLRIRGYLKANPPVEDAGCELENLLRVRALGIPTPRPVVAGRATDGSTFLVLEALEGTPADTLWAQGTLRGVPAQRMARSLAELVGRLHDARIAHRDLYLCHVWVLEAGTDMPEGASRQALEPALPACPPSLAIIDLERAAPRRLLFSRWRIKDLAALEYSATEVGVPPSLRLRFLLQYTDRDVAAARALASRIASKARSIARHGRKG